MHGPTKKLHHTTVTQLIVFLPFDTTVTRLYFIFSFINLIRPDIRPTAHVGLRRLVPTMKVGADSDVVRNWIFAGCD